MVQMARASNPENNYLKTLNKWRDVYCTGTQKGIDLNKNNVFIILEIYL